MDVCGQQVAQGVVYQAVSGHGAEALEAGRADPYVEVTAAIPGTGMPGVKVAFIGHLQYLRVKRRTESTLDQGDAIHRSSGHHGITWMNGLTWMSAHTPDST